MLGKVLHALLQSLNLILQAKVSHLKRNMMRSVSSRDASIRGTESSDSGSGGRRRLEDTAGVPAAPGGSRRRWSFWCAWLAGLRMQFRDPLLPGARKPTSLPRHLLMAIFCLSAWAHSAVMDCRSLLFSHLKVCSSSRVNRRRAALFPGDVFVQQCSRGGD